MVAPLIAAIAALIGLVAAWRSRQRKRPARTVIVSPRESAVIAHDGAVRSVQSAVLTTTPESLDRLWNPTNLENLGRTYWAFLSKVTLGFIRVIYSERSRRVVFLARPFTLLRFEPPEYVTESDHGTIKWRIRDGLLVARSGRGCGFLALDVRREAGAQLRIEVEVANFYPAIAAGFSVPVYEMTQSAIHVLVTHAFLRSLATLELKESKVGALRTPEGTGTAPEPAKTTQP
ncbi:MAG TPA: hypothetical protein VG410_02130 [Solirubrobacteraceae bacterium]|nr:hypothetical protein [Solirubrobacteraceae bacterium]